MASHISRYNKTHQNKYIYIYTYTHTYICILYIQKFKLFTRFETGSVHKVEQWSELTAKVISTVPPTCRIGKPVAQGDKSSHRSTVKWALARGPWGMAVAAEKINAWFDFAARECFEERHWEVAARLPEATLSHRSGALLCGHLIRFDMTNIFVEGAPENPCNLLVRPEVRGQYDQGNSLKFWQLLLCFSNMGIDNNFRSPLLQ